MKITNTRNLPLARLVDYTADNLLLHLISSSSLINILGVEPESLGVMSNYSVQADLHQFYQSCVDDTLLYLPTRTGQILALDKFSGDLVYTIDLGITAIMSNLEQDEDNLYFICGIPISTKTRLELTRFCLLTVCKKTGKKKVQTNYFKGDPIFLTLGEKFLWVTSGPILTQYSKEGEKKESEANLLVSPSYKPMIVGEFIVCPYKSGLIKIIRQGDLSLYAEIEVRPNAANPMLFHDHVVWLTKNEISLIDIKNKKITKTIETDLDTELDDPRVLVDSKIFMCSKNGHLSAFDLQQEETTSIKLTDKDLWKPVFMDGHIFVVSSDNNLYKIEV